MVEKTDSFKLSLNRKEAERIEYSYEEFDSIEDALKGLGRRETLRILNAYMKAEARRIAYIRHAPYRNHKDA